MPAHVLRHHVDGAGGDDVSGADWGLLIIIVIPVGALVWSVAIWLVVVILKQIWEALRS